MSLLDEFSIPNLEESQDEADLRRVHFALGNLRTYCSLRAQEVRLRREGKISAASTVQGGADFVLDLLPDSWKW